MRETTNELLREAKEISTTAGFVSISLLQRKMRIGYVDASRLIDIMVNDGFCEAKYDVYGHRKLRSSTNWLESEPAQ